MSDVDKTQIQRPVKSVTGAPQFDLFGAEPATPGRRPRKGYEVFVDPEPSVLTVGNLGLREYLESMGLKAPLLVREAVRAQDWRKSLKLYNFSGRRPYHPALIVGLVLYGLLEGKHSLRELEALPKKDLGAMWITGGAFPDHTTIGRCLVLHREWLTEEFFKELTSYVLKSMGSNPKSFAIDGTVVESVGSRFRVLKRDAALLKAQKAQEKAQAQPDDADAQQAAEKAKAVADAVEARAEKRRERGDKASETRVCETEPDAAYLKGKKGNHHPGYVASVAADENRVILAHHVHPTSELASFGPLVDQIERLVPEDSREGFLELLVDGSYVRGQVLQIAAERDISLICSVKRKRKRIREGDGSKSSGTHGKKNGKHSKDSQAQAEPHPRCYFNKDDFHFDETRQVYICPAGKELKLSGRQRDKRRDEEYDVYRASRSDCKDCPLLKQCVTAKTEKRKTIYRWDTDHIREALRTVMVQPYAKKRLAKRKAMVEPVFSELRGRQGLQKLRRSGLQGARLEFSLHACAHNLRRLLCWGAKASNSLFFYICALLLGLFIAARTARNALSTPRRIERGHSPIRSKGPSWGPCGLSHHAPSVPSYPAIHAA